MANVRIGDENVSNRTVVLDDEDWDILQDIRYRYNLKSRSAAIRTFLRAMENHPREMDSHLREARQECRKIQAVPDHAFGDKNAVRERRQNRILRSVMRSSEYLGSSISIPGGA